MMGPNGRLGNQIWAYANVLALAADLRVGVSSPVFQGKTFFKVAARRPVALAEAAVLGLAGLLPHWLWKILYSVNLRTRTCLCIDTGDSWMLDLEAEPQLTRYVSPGGLVFLSGLFLSAHASMERQRDLLSASFSLCDEYENRKALLVGGARQRADVLVGVHIRHGDYRTYCNGLMYYSIAQYVTIMKLLEQQLSGRVVRFLVCSDEPQDAVAFDGLDVMVSREIPVVDMYALSSCDYIVGPNSSFSQWASFVGKVPIHVLDYKSAELRGDLAPKYVPSLQSDFAVFKPTDFSRFSAKKVCLADYVQPTQWWHRY